MFFAGFIFLNINDDDNGLLTGFPWSGSSLVGQKNAVATEIKMREIENKYLWSVPQFWCAKG